MKKAPVAYFVFNRPQLTAQTFAVLRKQKPFQLFIIADGPRSEHRTDSKNCATVRTIVEQVDWPCEVHRNYNDFNLGLKLRFISGLDWVFRQVESAIILEDDNLAHPDFFYFCNVLLERYAKNEKIGLITGNNFQNYRRYGDASYYFSKYSHTWGWATWRRSWKQYQGDMSFWKEWTNSKDFKKKITDPIERHYWQLVVLQCISKKIDSWAYPWLLSNIYKGNLVATPNTNLVSNIGFGPNATHTTNPACDPNMTIESLTELIHPSEIKRCLKADEYDFNNSFGGKFYRWPYTWILFIRNLVNNLYKNF